MKTLLQNILAALSLAGLLASLSSSAIASQLDDNPEIRAAAKNATTRSDHEAIAKYYEEAATQMQAKVKEKKELLEQYEKVRLYGWQSHNLKSQTLALIRKYEQTAQSNMKEATSHRQMASGSEVHHYAIHGGQAPHSGSN